MSTYRRLDTSGPGCLSSPYPRAWPTGSFFGMWQPDQPWITTTLYSIRQEGLICPWRTPQSLSCGKRRNSNIPNWTTLYYAHNHHTPAHLMIPMSGCHHSGKEDFPKYTPYRMEEHLLTFTVSQSLAAFEKSLIILAPLVSFMVVPMNVTFQTFLSFFIMCIISYILL